MTRRERCRKNYKKEIKKQFKIKRKEIYKAIKAAACREITFEFNEEYSFLFWLIARDLEKNNYECASGRGWIVITIY